MSGQTIHVTHSLLTGSQQSVVLPSSPLLQTSSTSVAALGGTGSTGFTDGIEDHIYPLLPVKIPRYKRGRNIDDEVEVDCSVNALQDEFSIGPLPDGWEQITHPEGTPYFYHADRRIVTECWIFDPQLSQILAGFIDKFDDFTRSRNIKQPQDAHLVLEINIENGINWCGYYYVSASTRSVFWLEKFRISKFLTDVRGQLSPTHCKLFLEYQYWYHWDLFPNVNDPSKQIYDYVANTIADARTDVQSSHLTTINQTTESLKEMADVVESANMKDRYINYHGQFTARLNYSQSIYSKTQGYRRTMFIKIFSPLLFAAPNVHLKILDELWVDELTLKARWTAFFIKLNSQWGEHLVHASILLNANVAFLAIPSNDPSNNSPRLLTARTAAQIASYISVVTSFASMMLALLLVRQHKAKERGTEDVKHNYLMKHYSRKRGFEDLAIIYSLPYALLTWGMGSFLVAFMLMCFVKSTTTVRATLGISLALICGLIMWCIWMFWEETDIQWRKWFRAHVLRRKEDQNDEGEQSKDDVTESTLHDDAASGHRPIFGLRFNLTHLVPWARPLSPADKPDNLA
ncbi:hypothetical protein DXG01_007383 [Tephrocybe rancida]|nr:hypothetical protein DXG01_007383 [Tephrocybe rancida]